MALTRSWLRNNLDIWVVSHLVQLGHQRHAQLAAYCKPRGGILAVDGALNIEPRIDPLYDLDMPPSSPRLAASL